MKISFLKDFGAGIDLGSNIRIYVKDKGVLIDEPFAGIVDKRSRKFICAGEKAIELYRKYPDEFILIQPVLRKDIYDSRAFEKVLSFFINKAMRKKIIKPKILLTASERFIRDDFSEIKEIFLYSGVRGFRFISSPLASAAGAGEDIRCAKGVCIADIGAECTDIALIALGKEIISYTLGIGGNDFNRCISEYLKKKYSIKAGNIFAEKLKIAASEEYKEKSFKIKGQNIISKLPDTAQINISEINPLFTGLLQEISLGVKKVLEKSPEELLLDVSERGILLTGGGSLISGIDTMITEVTGIKCEKIKNASCCAAEGAGKCIDYVY